MGKDNYFGEFASLLGGGGINSFFRQMFADMDKRRKEQENEAAGIDTSEGWGKVGVPSKNILPHYDYIDFVNDKFYYCYHEEENGVMVDVHDKDGNALFFCLHNHFDYLGEGIFLVKEEKDGMYALHNMGSLVSDFVFRHRFSAKFTPESDYCVLGYKSYSGECVVNKQGEVVFEKSGYDELYLYGNIVSEGKKYYNLLTKELICEKDYSSRSVIDIKDLLFVESNGQVYKIDKKTCEFEVFGEPKQAPKTNDVPISSDSPTTVAEIIPTLPKQGRNEKCACGSGLKYKNCCINK